MVTIAFCLKVSDRNKTELSLAEKLWHLDSLSSVFLISGIICLILGLQWGGRNYAVR